MNLPSRGLGKKKHTTSGGNECLGEHDVSLRLSPYCSED